MDITKDKADTDLFRWTAAGILRGVTDDMQIPLSSALMSQHERTRNYDVRLARFKRISVPIVHRVLRNISVPLNVVTASTKRTDTGVTMPFGTPYEAANTNTHLDYEAELSSILAEVIVNFINANFPDGINFEYIGLNSDETIFVAHD
jgi:hypothetical protein